jgi:hypothetical protein
MNSMYSLVHAALVRRARRRGTDRVNAPIELRDDVELMPLEIVLVALDVEQSTARPWPVEELASVRTVGDLLAFFSDEPSPQPGPTSDAS